ncbi:Agc/akt protein kinase, partial [Globisporangium splendens]
MQDRERPRFTLFAPEDAEAMAMRERSTMNGGSSATSLHNLNTSAAISKFLAGDPPRASPYSLRPSQTFYGRDSFGGDTDASVTSSSVADGSGSGNGNSGVAGASSGASRVRLSVCADENDTFDDMFETDWEGYLWKQGHVVRSWRYRYAILSGTTFSYYVSKDVAMIDTEKFRGRVTVTGARKDDARANGVLVTTTINKVFALYTRTAIESEIWIKMIQQAVQNASGQKMSTSATTTSGGCDSDLQQQQQQMYGRNTLTTNAILAQTVRSSLDWKTRNLNTVRQFYSLWTAQFLEPRGVNESAANFIGLFPLCSTDMILTVRYPCEFFPSSVFHGREGLVDVVLGLSKFVQFRKFTVSRYLNTKQPNVMQVLATGKIWNKSLQREFAFNTRDELQLSPGGRVLSMQMHIEVDLMAFQMSDSDKKSVKNDRVFQATTSKRVLSLSIQHFHVNRVLGKGTFGTVVLAERKNTGEIFAVKILEKSSMSNYDKLRTKTEMRILRDVHHPFIAPLRFSFQSHSRVFLGMEYYPGGSLYTHMNRFSNNKEHRVKIAIDLPRVRFYVSQIVLALCHLHACDIVYRDLKPDNIMIDDEGNVALVDFGLSKTSVSQLSGARTMAGSPAYTAPELLKPKRSRDYGKAVDWWCLGILIYEMLLAKRPFHHLNVSVLYKLIEKDPVKFPPKCNLPPEARSLIIGLLEKDPTKRLGARQASEILMHPFFKDTKWDLVLRKKIQPPWVPAPLSLEEEKMKNPDINYDKFLASKTYSTGSFFSMIFAWRSPHSRARRKPERDNDTFGKFSYVSDTTNSFLVDEDEMLDSAFTGRRSIQLQNLSGEV